MKKQKQIRSNWMLCICAAVTASAGWFGLVNTNPVLAAESVGEEMVVSNDVPDTGDSVNLRSPSLSVSESGNEELCSELSPSPQGLTNDDEVGVQSADGVSGSPYTSSSHQTDEQSDGGRGLPSIDEGELYENALNTGGDENLGVYDFKDNKTAGTVTVTGVWDDDKTNAERPIPDIKISTTKPSKSALGYTVTFHGDKDTGLVFGDGSDVNEVIYNSSGQIVDGVFKVPGGVAAGAVSWFTDEALSNKVDVSENGVVQMTLSGDVDLWMKAKTFEIKRYNGNSSRKYNDFNYLIPNTVTEIFFTDEIKPAEAEIIDVDADGDGGVVAWTENEGATMKVSTQVKGVKVQAAKNSGYMFYGRNKFTKIDFTMFDTQNVTNMKEMFDNCSGLTSLDLTPLDTSNVTDMSFMFSGCSGLTALDLSPLDTQKVTNMRNMFANCSSLTSLDLSPLDTQNVTYMSGMFYNCSSLTSLDLSPLDTQKVTNMQSMFYGCSGLTSLDLSPLDTQKVTNMQSMFYGCSGLTSLDLSPLDTQKVTDMYSMFYGCHGLTKLTTGPNFKFAGTIYSLSGTWQNTVGETFTSGSFPSNIADTYTKISN